jgi:hypothetical protein
MAMEAKVVSSSRRFVVFAFFSHTTSRLLARIASLQVLARFLGGGAGCGDTVSGADAS